MFNLAAAIVMFISLVTGYSRVSPNPYSTAEFVLFAVGFGLNAAFAGCFAGWHLCPPKSE